jgi:hypothetical protein
MSLPSSLFTKHSRNPSVDFWPDLKSCRTFALLKPLAGGLRASAESFSRSRNVYQPMKIGSVVKSRLEVGSSEGSPVLELEHESQYSKPK